MNLSVFEMVDRRRPKRIIPSTTTRATKKSKIRLFMIEAKYGNRHRNRTISINYEYWWWCRLIINSNVCVRVECIRHICPSAWMKWGECALPHNKPNGYARDRHQRTIYRNDKVVVVVVFSHCRCLKLIYLKLRRHIFFSFFVSIVFNSYFIFSTCSPVILVIIILMRCFASFTFFYPVE